MTLTLTLSDAGLRVLLTLVAGLVIGLDRSAQGHPAGPKTTTLVALAACFAMLQANWLMNSVGKAPDSFVVLDLMRLPLGILTGVGFIGGGAILKHGDSVAGLTTAATLWFVTVIGLCFGGGQLELGIAGSALGLAVLRLIKPLERRLRQERSAEIVIRWRDGAYDLDAALRAVAAAGLRLDKFDIRHDGDESVEELRCRVRRWERPEDHGLPAVLAALSQSPGVLAWEWKE
jgi:putative Mg2+ transporter-C (MgtC) family protein